MTTMKLKCQIETLVVVAVSSMDFSIEMSMNTFELRYRRNW